MTPEEIQSTLEQMLAVQRQIQESQIKNTDNIARLEQQVQANAQQIQENTQQIQENAALIRNDREDIRSLKDDIRTLVGEIAKLTVDQREKFNQFYDYHQAADSDRLNIVERLIKVEQEILEIKRKLKNQSS
ncbi:MAG: hypothetical protein QNJ18_09720 [Xenococcaceae cyanobacterium MO_167.B52]|nr:hypothetical protein [Xenococcaceae cyanobacterium MO_167.B52]